MNIIREYQPRRTNTRNRQERSKAKAVKRPFPIRTLLYLYIAYMLAMALANVIGNGLAVEVDSRKSTISTYSPRTYSTSHLVSTNALRTGIDQTVTATQYIVKDVEPLVANTEEPVVITIEPEVTEEPVVEEYIEPEVIPYHQDDFNRDSSVMCMSGLTAEQIEGMLDNYPGLTGLGEAIYNIEQEHGVNAFYTLAVASLESGYGKSQLAVNKNNLFGLMGCSFDSKEDCVAYFGRLMINYRDKHDITMTPNGINPRYCTTDTWASKVTQLMNQWAHKANELY